VSPPRTDPLAPEPHHSEPTHPEPPPLPSPVALDVEAFRAALAREAASARSLLASLGSDIADIVEARRDSNNDDEHDPEGATLAFERSQADALRRSAQDRLAAIDHAEQRLIDGSYGTCVVCSGPIPVGRLEARPWADRCVSCV